MNIQRIVVVAAGILTLTVIPPSHAAGAAASSGTQFACTYGVHLAFAPGISPAVEAIRITSSTPGPLSCQGTWAGRPLTGQGTVVFEGDAIGSCGGSTIDAVLRMDHPLADGGRMRTTLPLRSGRVGMAMYGVSRDAARPASLVGTGTPDPGQDCRQVPITGIAAQGRAVFGLGLTFRRAVQAAASGPKNPTTRRRVPSLATSATSRPVSTGVPSGASISHS